MDNYFFLEQLSNGNFILFVKKYFNYVIEIEPLLFQLNGYNYKHVYSPWNENES